MTSGSWYQRFRAILHLILVQSLVPISLTFTLIQCIDRFWKSLTGRREAKHLSSISSDKPRGSVSYTVVLTGGKMSKTLHMARCLRQYALSQPEVTLRIVVLESKKFRDCATRFSRCVDNFHVITSPRESPEGYMNGIFEACRQHKATHFLPVAAPVEAIYDAQLKERLEKELNMTVLHMDHELCCILDDKHRFGSFLREQLHVRSPRTHIVESGEEAHDYNKIFAKEQQEGSLRRNMILKNLEYDPIHRLDLFQLPIAKEKLDAYITKVANDGNPITKEAPWQLQEFLAGGEEYAAMIVVRENELVTVTFCPSSASQLNYIHVEIPSIRSWLEDFMKGLRDNGQYVLTGQLCFDFMVLDEEVTDSNGMKSTKKVAYPIECNPRVHTQCTIYNRDDVRASFGSLLLDHSSTKSRQLEALLDRDYVEEKDFNIYWFYNEFMKIFPNSFLLRYNDSSDNKIREKILMQDLSLSTSLKRNLRFYFLLYLPSFITSLILVSPVLICFILSSMQQAIGRVLSRKDKSTQSALTFSEHSRIVAWKSLMLLQRLAEFHVNAEGDMWSYDPVPFLAKNHIQIPSRLLATIRTGVEWKKIDFAIGKVVEVGGD